MEKLVCYYGYNKNFTGEIKMTEYEDAEFWNYIVVDKKTGNMIGVRDDMPESARADYEGFLEEQRYAKEHGMKI